MIATVILAAGEARRMGQPKQLMQLQGQSLVQRAVQTASAVSQEVIVVTGAYADVVQKNLHQASVTIIHNPDWASGMGSSIRAGVQQALYHSPAPEAIIILLCDQPLVSEKLLRQLIKMHQDPRKNLVASSYQNTVGVPALFGKALFPDLLALDNKGGAKQVIRQHQMETVTVDFPEGAYDVDTPEDFERIQRLLISE